MKKNASLVLSILSLAVLSSCATARQPVTGFWYSDTQSSVTATAAPAGNRVGEACVVSYLGAYAKGDATIETARRNGGIREVSSVDETATSILGIYAKYCTIVRGK
jgi:hypothetical protein